MRRALKNRLLNLATQLSFPQSPVPLLISTLPLVCLISCVLKGLCLASKAFSPNPYKPTCAQQVLPHVYPALDSLEALDIGLL